MQVSPAHWHLLVNHFPIILIITAALFLGIGLVFKKDAIKSTALMIAVLAALTGMIANATGEGAEEQVEELPGISHEAIHIHEEAAETGLMLIVITGALALISSFVFMKNKKNRKYFCHHHFCCYTRKLRFHGLCWSHRW